MRCWKVTMATLIVGWLCGAITSAVAQAPCGAEGQRACCVLERVPACDAGLQEVVRPSSGRCGGWNPFGVQSNGICAYVTPCGGEEERACCVGESSTACGDGLVQAPFSGAGECSNLPGVQSSGICRRPGPCGAVGQRACTIFEPRPGCESGLVEIDGCVGECFLSSGMCADLQAPLSEPSTGYLPTDHASDAPLRGFADTHVHMFSHLAFGGGVMAGLPYDPKRGIRGALAPDYGTDLDLVSFIGTPLSAASCPPTISDCGRLLFHGDHTPIDDSVGQFTSDRAGSNFGAPLFNGWPSWRSTTHQQVYYKWLERAWRGGMRLMTMLAVDNEALCLLSKRRRDADCDRAMDGIDAQIAAAKDFERWLDQQPDGGWFKIVYDPAEAEAVIRSGKLAVVLGIEVDSLFDCKRGSCSAEDVRRKVDTYYALGIRHIFPTHDFDTDFAGTALWSDILNAGNAVTTGEWYEAETCSTSDFALSPIPVLSDIPWLLGRAEPYPSYPSDPVCNGRGLTDLGAQLVAALMDKGMLIDVDHMSARAIDRTIELARSRDGYPLLTGHTLFAELYAETGQRHERMRTADQLQAIRELGGLVSVMTSDELTLAPDCKFSTHTFALNYRYARSQLQGPVAFGTDFNGLAAHTGPRFGDDACSGDAAQARTERRTQPRLSYPFELAGFGAFERQVTGQRTFDFNTDGLAHIGLLPDMIADLQTLGVEVEPLFQSAQAYVQTWRRALDRAAPDRQ